MKRILFAVMLAGVAACKKDEPVRVPVKAVVGGLEMIDYQEPSGAFEVQGPADWLVKEDDRFGPSVSLLGPGTPKFPRSVSIHVSRYPNVGDPSPDPKRYYEGIKLISSYRNISSFDTRDIGGRQVQCYSAEMPRRPLHSRKISYYVREDVAIIPIPGGYYRIEHTAPVDIYKETLPVFEAVVASFKPGKG